MAAKASAPLSLRMGSEGRRALEDLARLRGLTRAEAARQAIGEAAERERRRSGLAAEARALAEDPAYRAEAQRLASEMDELRLDPW